MPKVSVIVAVYNTELYLEACIESVLAQTLDDLELILVDDGSTDASLALEHAAAQRDGRVRVIEQTNQRQGAARNRGISCATGEYLCFLDSDDLLCPQALERAVSACAQDKLDIFLFETQGFVDNPHESRPDLFPELPKREGLGIEGRIMTGREYWGCTYLAGAMFFVCWAALYARSFIEDHHLRFPEGVAYEDNEWTLRTFLAAERVEYLPLRLHRYRDRPGSDIHAGFRPSLVPSCFAVHLQLVSMLSEQASEVQRRMVEDTIRLSLRRFDQVQELAPSDELVAQLNGFARRVECAPWPHGSREDALLQAALFCLRRATAPWGRADLDLGSDRYGEALYAELLQLCQKGRVAFYGTGIRCRQMLELVDIEPYDAFFVDRSARPGMTVAGKPVVAVSELASLRPDAVVITSKRYFTQMRRSVQEALGADVPVYMLPVDVLR